jgi:hypothetical protein
MIAAFAYLLVAFGATFVFGTLWLALRRWLDK